MSSPHEIEEYIWRFVGQNKAVLDIGSGLGKNAYIIRVYHQPRILIGIDMFLPSLKTCKFHRIYDDVVLSDAHVLPFKSGTFDIVIASEIIGHMEKGIAIKMLEEAERIATERVIVATPNKAERQEYSDVNPWEARLSSWTVNDFRNRGYKVFGIGFGSYTFATRFGRIAYFLEMLFRPLIVLLPILSKELVAVKEKSIT
jgi:SAM-dependent methyltransferase